MNFIKHKQSKSRFHDLVSGISVDYNYEFVTTVNPLIHDNSVNNVLGINKYGLSSGRDYMFVRSELTIIYQSGWVNFSLEEKKVFAQFGICTTSEALENGVFTQTQWNSACEEIIQPMYLSRKLRVDKSKKKIGAEVVKGLMSYTDSNLMETDTRELVSAYITGNNTNFIDWINATGAYTVTGFSSKSYYTSERRQYLVDYIIDGKI